MAAFTSSKAQAANRLKAVRKKKLYEEIVVQIRDLIKNGELKVGDQLPPERELSEIFNVSRHSVREAIRALEQQGVLKSRRGSGTFVVLGDANSIADFLAFAVVREKDKLAEIFQFREMIEPQIAALAAQNASEEEIERCRQVVANQKMEADSTTQIKLDDEFHRILAEAAGNEILLNIVERINGILGQSRKDVYQSDMRSRVSITGHDRVLEALELKDPELAERAMREHISQIKETVFVLAGIAKGGPSKKNTE